MLGLVEEVEDESEEVDDTIGQHEDESEEHEDTIEEVDDESEEDEQDELKVGLDLNKDMKKVNSPETLPLTHDMDMDLNVGAATAVGALNMNE
jgi:hypothetical protein